MSSLSNCTSDIEIQHPECWSLIMRLGSSAIKLLLYSNEESNSLISREIPLDIYGDDYLKALENCIYDNPVLIQDYKRVAVSIESSRFVVLPPEIRDEDTVNDIMDYIYAESLEDRYICDLSKEGKTVVFTVPLGVIAFLQRTFNMPEIVHHLVPLCSYSALKSEKSGISKMFVYLSNNRMDMCIYRKGELQMTNTFRYRNDEEPSYYILNAWQTCGLNTLTDELHLSGDKSVRDLLVPILRKYISYVMPIMFPATAMRIGQDAIKAPFDLILLSQCEL